MFDWINGLVGSHSPLGLLCLTLFPGLVPLHVMADAIIALAYYTIPLAIIYFARNRRDLVYSWLFWATALFITACGTGHVMDIWVCATRITTRMSGSSSLRRSHPLLRPSASSWWFRAP